MKKILIISSLLLLFIGFFSCEKDEPVITSESMVGKWLIYDKAFGFTTDCERNEYILFNADNSLIRYQCNDTIYGSWNVQNKELILDLVLDTTYTGSEYKCELLSEGVIKIKAVNNVLFWATYKKQ